MKSWVEIHPRALNGPLIFKKAWSAVRPQRKITSLVAATRSVMAFTAKSCITCRTCRSSVGSSLSSRLRQCVFVSEKEKTLEAKYPKSSQMEFLEERIGLIPFGPMEGNFMSRYIRGIRYFKDLYSCPKISQQPSQKTRFGWLGLALSCTLYNARIYSTYSFRRPMRKGFGSQAAH